jgi:hypothetical protein
MRADIGWGRSRVPFIWPLSHLCGKFTPRWNLHYVAWWGHHLGHYSGPIGSLSHKSAKCASKFGWILSLWVMLIVNKFTKVKFLPPLSRSTAVACLYIFRFTYLKFTFHRDFFWLAWAGILRANLKRFSEYYRYDFISVDEFVILSKYFFIQLLVHIYYM